MKLALTVLHNEHDRITDPLMLITLYILISKEETNNITFCLENFRNRNSLIQIIRKKIIKNIVIPTVIHIKREITLRRRAI